MVGFFLKKAFFDGWDNLISLALLNLGFVLILLGFLSLPMLFVQSPPAVMLITILLIYALHFYAGGVSVYCMHLINGRNPGMKQILQFLGSVWKISLIFGSISAFQTIVLMVGFPFYLSMGGVIGLTAASVLFWFSIFWWFVTLWIYPVRGQLDETVKGVFKKSLFISLDNIGFTIFLGLYTIINFALSAVTAFLIPGMSGILLSHQIALKLRMYKYEYLEQNPDRGRRSIPWDALLLDEKEKVGERTLKGMIFPWKE